VQKQEWWKKSVVYQIYPKSFLDTSGSGTGDIKGIIKKLDYLAQLGVDVIWLCPVYKSPEVDNGYDISDYYSINPRYGSMEDFDNLLAAAHDKGIRIVMDLVVNHSSDQHPWFKSASTDPQSPYRDYYIFKEGKGNQPPNNWGAFFGGPAWSYLPALDQYYLHIFSSAQPDLNWENPQLRQEVYKIMRFWLDKGIDGFRMDVINLISKVPGLPEGEKGPQDLYGNGFPYFANGPRLHEFLQEMHDQVLRHYDILTVGEMPGATVEVAQLATGQNRKELNMVFQFEHVDCDAQGSKWNWIPFDPGKLKKIMYKWQEGLEQDGWNSLYWNNHDQPRVVSRFGNDSKEYRVKSAQMLGTVLHMLKGTPYIYMGEEIGMANWRPQRLEDYKDLESIDAIEVLRKQNQSEEAIAEALYRKSRDNARTPMQWNKGENAGFTSGTPWLPINPRYKEINVLEDTQDPQGVFQYYQKLIKLRKEEALLSEGDFKVIGATQGPLVIYSRNYGKKHWLVVANMSQEPQTVHLGQEWTIKPARLVISNSSRELLPSTEILLEGYDAYVWERRD